MKKLATELVGRTLRFDGVSVVPPDVVAHYLLRGVPPSMLRVAESSPDVESFNHNVSTEEELLVAQEEPVRLSFAWQLPAKYQQLDLVAHVGDALQQKLVQLKYSGVEQEAAFARVADELAEIEKRGMVDFMRTVIYILDIFRAEGVVWGVGRGSSCASFILFILGLHSVDCLRLDVPFSEFFHD